MRRFRLLILASVVVAGWHPILPAEGWAGAARPTLSDLPERVEVQIPAWAADILADVERVAASLPGMDRRRAYLVTLPLENHLKDVVLSADRIAVLYPRAMAWFIGSQSGEGKGKLEVSKLLVTYFQKDLFREIPAVAQEAGTGTGAPEAQ